MPVHRTHTYTIIVPLETFEWRFSGGEITWPRHITVVPDFRHIGGRSGLLRTIEGVAEQHEPFDITFSAPHTNYGKRPAQDVATGAESLRCIHEELVKKLGDSGCTFLRSQYTVLDEGYNPHCSGLEPLSVYQPIRIWTLMVIAKYIKQQNIVQASTTTKQIEDAFRLGVRHVA